MMYTVQCTHYIVYSVHYYKVYGVYYTLYGVHCTTYTIYCTTYTIHCTTYTIQCTEYTIHCTTYIVQCTAYGASLHVHNNNGEYYIQKIVYITPRVHSVSVARMRRARTHYVTRYTVLRNGGCDIMRLSRKVVFLQQPASVYCVHCTVYIVQYILYGVQQEVAVPIERTMYYVYYTYIRVGCTVPRTQCT